MKRAIVLCAAAVVGVALIPAPARAVTTTTVPLPFLWPTSALTDVEADSPSDVWVTGIQGAYCLKLPWDLGCRVGSSGNPVIRRWTGSSWREYPQPDWSSEGGGVISITTSGGEVWATGRFDHSYRRIARFDGTAFQDVALPAPAVGFVHTGPAGTWTAPTDPGSQAVFRWSGTAWAHMPVPAGLWKVTGVSSTQADEAFAVGLRAPQTPAVGRAALARWDGTSWHDIALPEAVGQFRPSEVAAAGPGEAWMLAEENGLAQYKGGEWRLVGRPPNGWSPIGLHLDGTGAPVVVAAGRGTGPEFGAVYRYSAGSWQKLADGSATVFRAVSHVPGTATLWAVGARDDNATAVTIEP
ncbi:hypothetical protein [Spirillospora sp. NPDC047279]|uniref:hypothetical protein n=1 Tax=Spirillospora sp. NPDC047279 TaxID=3155478 RepID=UPI0033DD7B14